MTDMMESAPIHQQLENTNSQLELYARDLKRVFSAEREKTRELEASNRQLQSYAADLKALFKAEKQRAEELESAYCDMVLRLARASKYKDAETGAHIQRLGHYSRFIALKLGWSPTEAEMLSRAAPMHDVGKMGVPDAVLFKQGPLTAEEWDVMKLHPGFGASLLDGSTSPLLQMSRDIALTHHERWDGTGYPQGLKGEAIPLPGRIVLLADQYDALRSKRYYKPGFDHETTRRILLEGDGRTEPEHFDPQVLQIFREFHLQFAAIFGQFADE